MIQVNISNHPDYPFFKRKVVALGLEVPLDLSADPELAATATMGNEVVLHTLLRYFQEDETPATIIPDKRYPLKADKGTWVNQSGEIVPEFIDAPDPDNEGGTIQAPNPEAFMNQYAFFMMLVDMKQPVVFDELIRKHIKDADELFQRYNA